MPSVAVKEKANLKLFSQEGKSHTAKIILEGLAEGLKEAKRFFHAEIISPSDIELLVTEQAGETYPDTPIAISQNLKDGLTGDLNFLFSLDEAREILAIIMGGENTHSKGVLDSAEIAVLEESFFAIFSGINSYLSRKMQVSIHGEGISVRSIGSETPFFREGRYLRAFTVIRLEGGKIVRFNILLPVETANELLLRSKIDERDRTENEGVRKNMADEVNVKDIAFPSLSSEQGDDANSKSKSNLNLLMDVQMTMTVELGRTKMFIKEILALGEGSIIELDKLAGEPVDLLVNGKLVAKGEVVVIDENFGVRVTDIVTWLNKEKIHKFSRAKD